MSIGNTQKKYNIENNFSCSDVMVIELEHKLFLPTKVDIVNAYFTHMILFIYIVRIGIY